MQYLLLIRVDEAKLAALPGGEREGMLGEYKGLIDELRGKGALLGAQRLKPAARIAQVRNGEASIHDGPFAETREQLGGYFLVDVPDREAATAIALRMPGARLGAIEIREIHIYS